ncbi:SusC/RagA family TonB-linked outer membrane protein [Filimonas effusa]|nr:TonB-dependent receptor [Filimonas effusa]
MIAVAVSAATIAQDTASVRGMVTDETGRPIAAVSVLSRNSLNPKAYQAITDSLGRFILAALPTTGTYHFDFVSAGYQQRSVTGYVIKKGVPNTVMVSLAIDEAHLQDVVVVGYGTQKKVNLTGAVNQISGDDLRDRPATNITSMLQGAIPNLNIRVASGAPGQMGSINIRGIGSINADGAAAATEPLILIDGIPGTLDRLSPEEVETITVLKDAASAAIYGARGAFGVVLVTTKTGASGKTQLRYNNAFSFSTPTVSTDFITTGYDWMKLNDDALAHIGGYSGYSPRDYEELLARRNDKTEDPSRPWITIQNRNGKDQYVYYGNYDWWDIMFTKWQPMQNHNISISGGTDKVSFMLNGNLKNKDGIMRMHTDKYSSKALRAKVTAKLYPWLKITNNTNFYHSSYDYFGREGGGSANFTNINVHASPAYAPMNPDGTATYITGFNAYDIGDGIFSMLINGNTRGRDRKYEFTTINEATVTPFKDFNITGNYSFNMYTDPSYYRQAPATYSLYPGVIETATKYAVDQLTETQQFNQVHVMNLYADYTKNINHQHNFKLVTGFNQELRLPKKITATRMDLASGTLNDLNLASGTQTVGGGSSEVALQGVFFRFNYDYKGRYLLEVNGRYDGSSRFPKGQRWGFFPSVSAGWRVSEEAFFSPLKSVVSDLKLRGSAGQLGNQALISNSYYPYISTITGGTLDYILNGEKVKYYNDPAPVSSNLTWEKINSYNGGADVSFLKNRLTVNLDYFVRKTTGSLANGITLPSVFGAASPVVNAADLQTKGFEVSVNWRDRFPVAGKPFIYQVGLNMGDNQTIITSSHDKTGTLGSLYNGKKAGEIWGYITDGFFTTDAEARTYPVNQVFLNKVRTDNNIPIRAGDLRWVDLNGDNKISSGSGTITDPGDQRVVGNNTPRYQYAINMSAQWNGFDLSVFFQGLGKMNWYPGNNADRFWGPYSRPYFSFIPKNFTQDIYSEANKEAYFPNLLAYVALNPNNELRATNNRYMQDLAYLRLKNITLGYTLPKQLLTRAKIQQLRLFVSAENLLTWTKLRSDYIDPEQAMSDANGRVYPFSKTIAFGIDLTF